MLNVQRVHRHLAVRALAGPHALRQLPVGLQKRRPDVPGRTRMRTAQRLRTVTRGVNERLLPIAALGDGKKAECRPLPRRPAQTEVAPPLSVPPLRPPQVVPVLRPRLPRFFGAAPQPRHHLLLH